MEELMYEQIQGRLIVNINLEFAFSFISCMSMCTCEHAA